MSGTTPIVAAPEVVLATPQVAGGRYLTYSPPDPTTTQHENLINVIKKLGHGMHIASILKEFEWQHKGNSDIKDLVIVIAQTSHMVFVFMKVGSFFIQLVHSVGKFGGDPFDPAKYRGRVIGFVGDRIQ